MDVYPIAIPLAQFVLRGIECSVGQTISRPTFYPHCPFLDLVPMHYKTNEVGRIYLGWYAGPLYEFIKYMHEYASYRLRKLLLSDIVLDTGKNFHDRTTNTIWYEVHARYAIPNLPSQRYPKIPTDKRQNPWLKLYVVGPTQTDITPSQGGGGPPSPHSSTQILYKGEQYLVRSDAWMRNQKKLLSKIWNSMPDELVRDIVYHC